MAFTAIEQFIHEAASSFTTVGNQVFHFHHSGQVLVNLEIAPLSGIANVSACEPESMTANAGRFGFAFDVPVSTASVRRRVWGASSSRLRPRTSPAMPLAIAISDGSTLM